MRAFFSSRISFQIGPILGLVRELANWKSKIIFTTLEPLSLLVRGAPIRKPANTVVRGFAHPYGVRAGELEWEAVDDEPGAPLASAATLGGTHQKKGRKAAEGV